MNIAIVGCGYVADYYYNTLGNHPQLRLVGVMDRERTRAESFASHWKVVTVYDSLDALLRDAQVDLVVNLTNPGEHYAVTRAALLAGKHVYSEKPLAMRFDQAQALVELAEARGLSLSCAPCSILGETARTVAKALAENVIGKVFLAYAELDDGMIHREKYRTWISVTGKPWPYKDEFETGCTLEHAAYYVTWLVLFFGSVRKVTSFASTLVADKRTDVPLAVLTPDFSVACLEFESGVTARVTCSIVAPRDRSLRIVGEDGILEVKECWDYRAPVTIRRPTRLRNWGERRHPLLRLLVPGIAPDRYPLLPGPEQVHKEFEMPYRMDFCRGIADQADALAQNRPARICARFALHVNEVVLCMQDPHSMGLPRTLVSRLPT